ncbi:MAG: HEPN domain-containing protein [Halothiobacillus sp.]|jgi:uncharacterized protein (UPF0332 family)|nr:HEPN domain-containing protein [Halothiobacillus sp.]
MTIKQILAESLLAKARQAGISSRNLFNMGDMDGAGSSSFYAMLHSARAALELSGLSVRVESEEDVYTLIKVFSEYLVEVQALPLDMAERLRRAEKIRTVADYSGDSLSSNEASMLVEDADRFVSSVNDLFIDNRG